MNLSADTLISVLLSVTDPRKRPDVLVGVVMPTTSTSEEEVLKVSLKEWWERTGFNKRAKV